VTAHDAAVVDTSIIAALKLYDPEELPSTILITAVTLGELSFGPHATDDPVKRAGRIAVLQHVRRHSTRSRTIRARPGSTARSAPRFARRDGSRAGGPRT